MKKKVFGRRFKKDKNQRQILFKGLMRSLALHEGIKTTEAKAKSIKGHFEKLITMARAGESARYQLSKELSSDAVEKLITEIGPRFKDRQGGYTRIIRLGNRLKDNAEMVLLELVEKGEKKPAVSKKASSKSSTKAKKTNAKVAKNVKIKDAKKITAINPGEAPTKEAKPRAKKGIK